MRAETGCETAGKSEKSSLINVKRSEIKVKTPQKVYVRCMFGVCFKGVHTPLNFLIESVLSAIGVCVYVCMRKFFQKKCENSNNHGHLHCFLCFSLQTCDIFFKT